MTLEEEGVYWLLCRRYWLAGSLPADLDRLRVFVKGRPSLEQMQAWWNTIGPCFGVRGERLTHKRLDRERQKQAKNRKVRKLAADKRWAEKHANALQMHSQEAAKAVHEQCLSSSSSTTSSTSTPVVKSVDARASVVPIRTPRSMGALGSSPAQHIGHARCNDRGVCLPQSLYAELLGRFANDVSRFDAFYNAVLGQMPDDYVPSGSVFRFWHLMLERLYPDLTASKPNARAAAMAEDF